MDASMLALVASVGKRPLHSPRLSSQTPLTVPLDPPPSALDTLTSQLTPTLSTPTRRLPLESSSWGTPMLLRLAPQPSASLAAPPRQEPDLEEDMDSETQQGPESQQ